MSSYVCYLHFSSHEVQEFVELNGAIPIHIHFIHHIKELLFGWVLPQWSDHSSQFIYSDAAYQYISSWKEEKKKKWISELNQPKAVDGKQEAIRAEHKRKERSIPSPSLSKRRKASLNSLIWSSVRISISTQLDFLARRNMGFLSQERLREREKGGGGKRLLFAVLSHSAAFCRRWGLRWE